MNWLSLDRKQLANVENSLKEIIARAADEDSHTQFTPIALCQELVQKIIDQGISSEKDWLVIANLEILFVVRALFLHNGWSLDKLHYASASERKLKFASNLLGNKNVHKYEYCKIKEWDLKMEFDVVISNPPYQNGNLARDGIKTSSTLWPVFIKKSIEDLLKDNGFLLFVSPQSWMGPGKQLLRSVKMVSYFVDNQTHVVNLDCGSFFNVGSSFSYFLIEKTPNIKSTTFIKNGKTFEMDLRGLSFVPNGNSEIENDIIRKVLLANNKKIKLEVSSKTRSDSKHVSKIKDEEHKYPVRHTNTETLWSSLKPSHFSNKKVILNSSGTFLPIYDNGENATSQLCRWIDVPTEDFGKRLADFISNNRIIKICLQGCRYSGCASSDVLASIPFIDFSRSWTDAELYAHFGLTQEEIDLIESTVK